MATGHVSQDGSTDHSLESKLSVAVKRLRSAGHPMGAGTHLGSDCLVDQWRRAESDITGVFDAISHQIGVEHLATGPAGTAGGVPTLPGAACDLHAVVTALDQLIPSLSELPQRVSAAQVSALWSHRHRAALLTAALKAGELGIARMKTAQVCVLIDGRSSRHDFMHLIESLVAAEVGAIQLRDKHLTDRELRQRGELLRKSTDQSATLYIMNDRPDLAHLTEADGVHIGQDDGSVAEARNKIGPDRLVGVSIHSIQQARQAVLDGANYIGVGPTFPSVTKRFEQFPGIALLRSVASEIRLPAFAIGGICRDNLGQLLDAGIGRIAVSSAVINAPDPEKVAHEFVTNLKKLG